MSSERPAPSTTPLKRLVAVDLMRGLVMVLMAVDHSSDAFNAGRLFTDSVRLYRPDRSLPTAQFLVRWVTHLCAPTFLLLAGVGLAYTVRKEVSRGKSQLAIDRYLLTRGVLIAGFELWISYFVMPSGTFLLQVLYAIGTSYVLMIPLRRLPTPLSLLLSLGAVASLELGNAVLIAHFGDHAPLWVTLLFVPADPAPLVVGYPTLHWLALMLLGYSLASTLIAKPQTSAQLSRTLALLGAGSLLGFLAIRGLNGYGNMGLLRRDGSLVQWLHVSKYPPGLSYVTLELGICFLCLSGLFMLSARFPPKPSNLFLVLGQTPLFFYLLHFPLLVLSAHWLRIEAKLGLAATFLGAAAVVAVLYPACRAYRAYKTTHKHSLARYI
ncbi:MAG: heparan-alpha-glucosaminide N-acetyltransferase domain-containing protein [Myxococcales bacterium]